MAALATTREHNDKGGKIYDRWVRSIKVSFCTDYDEAAKAPFHPKI